MTDPSDSKGSPTPRRIQFRFSIRFLLLATLLIAVILVLSIKRARECQKEMAVVEELLASDVKIVRLPPSTFEKILGERFSKQSWVVNLAHDQAEHLELLSKLEKVKTIDVNNLSHKDLSAFSNFKNLESLTLGGAWELKTLDGIEGLQSLRTFSLSDAWRVTTARPLANLKKLEEVSFFHHDGNTCSFEDLDEVLHEMTGLKSFVAFECPVKSLDAFENCKNLEHLELWLDGAGITSLNGLVDLPCLQKLDLSDAGEIEDWSALQSMTELTELRITGFCTDSLDFLSKLKKLKTLELRLVHELLTRGGKTLGEALEPMLLPQLEKLSISSAEIVTLDEYFSLERFSQLRELTIWGAGYQPTEEEFRALLADPENSDLIPGYPLLKIARLKQLSSLGTLHLMNVGKLNSLDGIESLGSLKEFRLSGCTELSDIKTLKQLFSLKAIKIFNCKKIPAQQITNLKVALPNTKIVAY